jgi:hypothetical protein
VRTPGLIQTRQLRTKRRMKAYRSDLESVLQRMMPMSDWPVIFDDLGVPVSGIPAGGEAGSAVPLQTFEEPLTGACVSWVSAHTLRGRCSILGLEWLRS